jgi:hypothetical protein
MNNKNRGERPLVNTDVPGNQGSQHLEYGGIKGGTKLFTINEEGGDESLHNESPNKNQHSQDSEGFIAPAPMKRRTNSTFSKFFKK